MSERQPLYCSYLQIPAWIRGKDDERVKSNSTDVRTFQDEKDGLMTVSEAWDGQNLRDCYRNLIVPHLTEINRIKRI